MANCSFELLSAGIALASAVGGAFSAFGAMRSAAIARSAQEAAERSEKRVAVRELVVCGSELDIELQRVVARAADLKSSYRSLFAFSGSSNHSSEKLLNEQLEGKVNIAKEIVGDLMAVEFDVNALYDSGFDDINKQFAKTQQALAKVRSIREDIDREFTTTEAQLVTYQEIAIGGKNA